MLFAEAYSVWNEKWSEWWEFPTLTCIENAQRDARNLLDSTSPSMGDWHKIFNGLPRAIAKPTSVLTLRAYAWQSFEFKILAENV